MYGLMSGCVTYCGGKTTTPATTQRSTGKIVTAKSWTFLLFLYAYALLPRSFFCVLEVYFESNMRCCSFFCYEKTTFSFSQKHVYGTNVLCCLICFQIRYGDHPEYGDQAQYGRGDKH